MGPVKWCPGRWFKGGTPNCHSHVPVIAFIPWDAACISSKPSREIWLQVFQFSIRSLPQIIHWSCIKTPCSFLHGSGVLVNAAYETTPQDNHWMYRTAAVLKKKLRGFWHFCSSLLVWGFFPQTILTHWKNMQVIFPYDYFASNDCRNKARKIAGIVTN